MPVLSVFKPLCPNLRAECPNYNLKWNFLGEWNLYLRTALERSHRAGIFLGGYNGANPTLGCSSSPFLWWWLLSGSSLPLLWRGPRQRIDNRYFSPSVEGLTRRLARYERPLSWRPLLFWEQRAVSFAASRSAAGRLIAVFSSLCESD